jgi:hypothetical protein
MEYTSGNIHTACEKQGIDDQRKRGDKTNKSRDMTPFMVGTNNALTNKSKQMPA